MTSRDLVNKTLNFDSPPRVPRQMWVLPWAEIHHPEEVRRIQKRYPDDCTQVAAVYNHPVYVTGGKYAAGEFIDEWGCRFMNPEEGLMGIIREARIKDWSDLDDFNTPDVLCDLDRDAINRFCRSTGQFVYAGGFVRPYERFQFLRTMEQSFIDMMLEEDGYIELLRRIHQHYLKETEAWAMTDVDAVFLMDDWGTQQSLMVSPEVFRKHFKPMYADYCEIARQYGKYVFMHSDGNIAEIIPDLIEVGVHALNSQLFCMDLDKLEKECAGRITFWGEIDRQEILPYGNLSDVDLAVNQVNSKLNKNGGVFAQCEFGPAAKPENVERVFEAWNHVSVMRDAKK